MRIEIDNEIISDITRVIKTIKKVPMQHRSAYEYIYGLNLTVGRRGLFTYLGYINITFDTKEERDTKYTEVLNSKE